jgi:hypothetical protein
MRLKPKVRDGSIAALLCAAFCLASFAVHAQDNTPEQREELECKELEEQSSRTMFCKRHYIRQGYKDAWVADTVLDGGLIIMEGPRGAAFCVRPIVPGSITPCETLARINDKPPQDRRATKECRDAERDASAPEKCRSTYLRQGYKDIWRSGELSSFVVMQGNGRAVICFTHAGLNNTSRCQPLRRLA